MKHNELHNFIEDLRLHDIAMPEHQRCLKQALLASSRIQQPLLVRFQGAFTNNIRGVLSMSRTKTMVSSSLAVLAIVAVIGGVSINGRGNTVHAQALKAVETATVSVTKLSPEEMAKLNAQLGQAKSMGDFLAEAKQAKDLKLVSKAEFRAEFPAHPLNTLGTIVSDDGGQTQSSTLPVEVQRAQERLDAASTFLRYTAPNGDVVGIGVDANGLPIDVRIKNNETVTDDNSVRGSVGN